MKEKFIRFITNKSFYIPFASVAVCAAVIGGSVGYVHHNNEKLDKAYNELTATTNILQSTSVPLNETEKTDNGNHNGEDKAIKYLAEYDRITAQYEKKRAELEKKISFNNFIEDLVTETKPRQSCLRPKPQKRSRRINSVNQYTETEEEYSIYLEQYGKDLTQWEEESRQYDISVQEAESKRVAEESSQKAKEEKEEAERAKIQKQIDNLDKQYQKDIENLKKQYGIK